MQGLSFYDLISQLQTIRIPLLVAMVVLPVISWTGGRAFEKVSKTAAAKFLSIPVYVAVIPGTSCTLVVAYQILIAHVNILKDVDIVLCVAPIFSMAATLVAISKIMSFDDIPGFKRLSGLITIVGVSFTLVFLLSRLHIFVGFFTSIYVFFAMFIVLFVILQIGISKLK